MILAEPIWQKRASPPRLTVQASLPRVVSWSAQAVMSEGSVREPWQIASAVMDAAVGASRAVVVNKCILGIWFGISGCWVCFRSY